MPGRNNPTANSMNATPVSRQPKENADAINDGNAGNSKVTDVDNNKLTVMTAQKSLCHSVM